ncbi:MAG: glutaredoxin 3 [Candidatus Binatia bacterium]
MRIYTTSYCGYCRMAKRLLGEKGVAFDEIDVTDDPDVRERLVRETGRRTVPQVFIDDRPIGGFAELQALDLGGALDRLLADA